MAFLVDAAFLWFLIVYIGQDHDTTYISLAWKLLLMYIVVGTLAYLFTLGIPDSPHQWLRTIVGWVISVFGMGFWIHRNYIGSIKKVITVMSIYFGASMTVRLISMFFMEWYEKNSI